MTGFFGQNFGWLVGNIDTRHDFLLYGVGALVIPTRDHRHGVLGQAEGLVLMLKAGDSFRSPRGTVVEVLAYGPDRLAIRRTLARRHGPHGAAPPSRGRQSSASRCSRARRPAKVAKRGAAAARRRRDGDPARRRATCTRTPATGETATLEHVIEPCPAFPLVYFPSWLRWLAEGRVDGQDEPTFLGIMAVIDAAKGDSWVAGPPIAVQRALATALAPVANRRGYRASVD